MGECAGAVCIERGLIGLSGCLAGFGCCQCARVRQGDLLAGGDVDHERGASACGGMAHPEGLNCALSFRPQSWQTTDCPRATAALSSRSLPLHLFSISPRYTLAVQLAILAVAKRQTVT
jgi:hypothetical protein